MISVDPGLGNGRELNLNALSNLVFKRIKKFHISDLQQLHSECKLIMLINMLD